MLDATIPLRSVAPEPIDPMAAVGKVMQLRQMAQQGQAQDLQLQSQQREIAAQKLLDQVYATSFRPDGSIDQDRITQGLADNNAGHMIPGVIESINKLNSSRADLMKRRGDAATAVADHLGEYARVLQDSNFDPAHIMVVASQMQHDELVDPNIVRGVVARLFGPDGTPTNDPQALEALKTVTSTWLKQSPKQTELETARITAEARKAASAKPEQVGPGGATFVDPVTHQVVGSVPPTTPQSEPVEAVVGPDGKPVYVPRSQAAGKTPYQKPAVSVNTAAGGPALPGNWEKTGSDFLQTIPKEWRNVVESIADYRSNINAQTSMRAGPGGQSERSIVARWVQQVNPDWEEGVAPARIAARKSYTDGKSQPSRNIISLNTAISHVGKLVDAAKAMQNGDTQQVNAFVNWVKTSLGHPEVTNYQTAAQAVASESATTFKGAAGTDPEIAAFLKALDPSQSPAQLAGNQHVLVDLFKGRFDSLAGEYVNALGKKDMNFLTPQSRNILTKFGLDVNAWEPEGARTVFDWNKPKGAGPVTLSIGGKTYTFPSQPAADAFKREADQAGIK
jgi:hypothetical protein